MAEGRIQTAEVPGQRGWREKFSGFGVDILLEGKCFLWTARVCNVCY